MKNFKQFSLEDLDQTYEGTESDIEEIQDVFSDVIDQEFEFNITSPKTTQNRAVYVISIYMDEFSKKRYSDYEKVLSDMDKYILIFKEFKENIEVCFNRLKNMGYQVNFISFDKVYQINISKPI
jgi:hypothetical protein